MKRVRSNSATPIQSRTATPAASLMGSTPVDTPRSAAGGTKAEVWTVAEVPHKRGTQRVVYPCSVFAPFVHMGQDGAFGTVFSSTRLRDILPVVIKQQPLDQSSDCEACMRELAVLTHFSNPKLRHPNIIPVVKAWECDDSLYTVLPKLDCSLHIFMNECHGPVPPAQRMVIFSQLLSGLRHLHHYGVMHRDLKPENVVLMRDLSSVQLIDFGASRARADGVIVTKGKYVSTYPYRAPEVEDGSYTPAADIWALGCILARLVQGSTLFRGKEATLERDRLAVNDRLAELRPLCTEYEHRVLCMTLALDPAVRVGTEDLYEMHYEHTKEKITEHFPRISRRPAPKPLLFQSMEYDYNNIPTMRRNITVLTSRCAAMLRA